MVLTSTKTDSKSQMVCKHLWKASLNFADSAEIPKNAYNLTFFWTAFLYSVHDILVQNAVLDDVLKEYIYSVSYLFQIPMHDVEQLAALKELQRVTLSTLIDERINPCTPEGAKEVLNISLVLRYPDGNEPSNAKPTPMTVRDFMLSMLDVSTVVCKLFPNKTPPKSQTAAHRTPTASTSAPNVVASPSTNYGVIFVIVICVATLIAACIWIFSSPEQSVDPPPQTSVISTNPPETVPTLVAKPFPTNGFIFEEITAFDCVAPLAIETVGNSGYYFVVDPISFVHERTEFDRARATIFAQDSELRFFVSGNSTIEILVPLGSYEIYYATGSTWYGEEHLFGPDTVYQKCDSTFEFTKDANGYNGWTLSLYPVEYGNLDTDYVDEDEFPK